LWHEDDYTGVSRFCKGNIALLFSGTRRGLLAARSLSAAFAASESPSKSNAMLPLQKRETSIYRKGFESTPVRQNLQQSENKDDECDHEQYMDQATSDFEAESERPEH
jgi:hypothetical protein